LTDPAQAPLDVKTAVEWLKANADVDSERVAIIGTSIGANLACVAMANNYGVKLSVAISPRQSSVEALAGSTDLSFDSLYCAAAENDGGGAQKDTCNAFSALSGDPKATVIIEGSALHGKTLLSSLPDEWAAIVAFLQTNL
jgi:dienelactone hydrolase